MKQSSKEKLPLYVLICVLIPIMFFTVYNCCQKQNFHIDETYSYILSNSYDSDKLGNSDVLWNRWISKNDWNEFTTVQVGEQFAYDSVYLNNTTDAHPPLFYWCLHTVCSLFPNSFSKWYGLGLNIIFYFFSLIVLFFISQRVIENKFMTLLPVVLWGLSPIAVDTAMFIRMYSLLTLLTLLSVLLHLKMYQDGQNKKLLALTFLVTFLGAFTQYYFIIIAFCISVAYCIYKLIHKEYKQMLLYAALEIVAVILLFLLYPAAITQITGSSTNNIGNEIASNLFSVSGWLSTIYNYCLQIFMGWAAGLVNYKKITAFLILAAILLLVFLKIKNRSNSGKKSDIDISSAKTKIYQIVAYGAIVFAFIVIISKFSFKFVYVRYMYQIIPLIIVIGVMLVEWIAIKINLSMKVVFAIMLIFSAFNATASVATNSFTYLYQAQQNTYDSLCSEYGDVPVVLLCERNTYVLTANYNFLKEYSDVYVMSADDVSEIDDVLEEKNTENGILLMVWTDTDWASGYDCEEVIDEFQDDCTLFSEYKELQYLNFCDIYYVN